MNERDYSDFQPYEFDDSGVLQLDADLDHGVGDTPQMTAFLRRGGESVWVNAYAVPRIVVETYPPAPVAHRADARYVGVVRELPYGTGTTLAEKFAASVLRLEREGWHHARPDVVTGDPQTTTTDPH